MANQIEISIIAKNLASGVLDKIAAELGNIGGISGKAAAVALAAGGAVVGALIGMAKATVDYATEVRDLSRITGRSAEETSRFIQVADDVKISYADLTTALRRVVMNGIDPSINGMARLSDQYLALAPGVERSTFLLDNFGRSGFRMGQLMEMGGDGIRKMSTAVSENLVLSQRAIDEARKYEIAVDDLGDAWKGFTMIIGRAVIPVLTSLFTGITDHTRASEILIAQLGHVPPAYTAAYQSAVKQAAGEREAAAAIKMSASAAGELGEKLRALPGDRTITITTRYVTTSEYFGSRDPEYRAHGGPVQANKPYWVGERGEPELFVPNASGQIVPQSRVGGGAGGGVTLNLTYAPMLSTAGEYEMQQKLLPFIRRGLRDAGVTT